MFIISEGESVKFNGNGLLQYDLSNLQSPPSTKEDTIKLRFKTNEQNGVILYADGNQGDYISLELVRGALIMHIDLGELCSRVTFINQIVMPDSHQQEISG